MSMELIKRNTEIDRVRFLTQEVAEISHITEMVKSVLELLVTLGFSNARYYDVAYNVSIGDELLVLSAWVGADRRDGLIGYKINYRSSTLGNSGQKYKPSVDCASHGQKTPQELKWVKDLGLRGKCWVDIPLCVGKDLLGLIACDWPEGSLDLSSDDLALLNLIGSLIAQSSHLAPSYTLDRLRTKLTEVYVQSDEVVDLLYKVTHEMCMALNAGVTAVFKYHWETDTLEKVIEHVHPSIESHGSEFEETYPAGVHLTGHAWQDAQYRHIVDFQSLLQEEKYKHMVWQPSLDRHKALLGEITSVIYEVLGKTEPLFLLRVVNRTDNSKLPLVASHRYLIERLCEDISKAVDDMMAQRRLDSLQRIARGVVEKVDRPTETMPLISQGLLKEDIGNFAIMCHTEGSSYFCFEHYQVEGFSKPQGDGESTWDAEKFYADSLEKEGPFVLETGRLPEHTDSHHFVGYLHEKGFKVLLIFPIAALRTKGIMVCPLPETKRVPIARLKKLLPGKLRMLTTYAAIAGSCIEAAESHSMAEGARRLVGHIGHEVSTPVATLGQTALKTIVLARKSIPQDNRELQQLFAQYDLLVKDEMRGIGKTMEMALLVAQENQGRLQLHFRKGNLTQILKDAAASLQRDTEVHDQGRIRRYRIEFSPSCEKLGDLVCDPEFLQQAFRNLFHNAMKYSLPRFKDQPMVVKVFGLPQTGMSIVQVQNWGLGVPIDEFEMIFKPFVRGSIHDRLKAIRGMGLGLFIARRIIAAHGGVIFCQRSTPTLDDPRRNELLEGFETVFEVRLSHQLKPGIVDHVWEKTL